MDLTIELFGFTLGSPSPALVTAALLVAITVFAFAEHVAERRDDPRVLLGTLLGMASCIWWMDITPRDGRSTFATFVIECVLGAGLFGVAAVSTILVGASIRRTRHRGTQRPRKPATRFMKLLMKLGRLAPLSPSASPSR